MKLIHIILVGLVTSSAIILPMDNPGKQPKQYKKAAAQKEHKPVIRFIFNGHVVAHRTQAMPARMMPGQAKPAAPAIENVPLPHAPHAKPAHGLREPAPAVVQKLAVNRAKLEKQIADHDLGENSYFSMLPADVRVLVSQLLIKNEPVIEECAWQKKPIVFDPLTPAIHSAGFDEDANKRISYDSDGIATTYWHEIPLSVLAEHSGMLFSTTFKGDTLAGICVDGTVKVWRIADGMLLTTLGVGHTQRVRPSFNYAGDKVATASLDGTAKIWQVAGEVLLATLNDHPGYISSAVFNRQGDKVVTTFTNAPAKVWQADGKLLWPLIGHNDFGGLANFNHTGDRIVTASSVGTAQIWQIPDQGVSS